MIRRCAICHCEATARKFGIRVCAYHYAHGEDDPPCPTCNHPPPFEERHPDDDDGRTYADPQDEREERRNR